MQMIRDGVQAVGEFIKRRLKFSILIPTLRVLPTVVQHDVVVAQVSQAQAQDLCGGCEEQVLGNVASESVPVILFSSVVRQRKCASIVPNPLAV
jgi:hypothetical protein